MTLNQEYVLACSSSSILVLQKMSFFLAEIRGSNGCLELVCTLRRRGGGNHNAESRNVLNKARIFVIFNHTLLKREWYVGFQNRYTSNLLPPCADIDEAVCC